MNIEQLKGDWVNDEELLQRLHDKVRELIESHNQQQPFKEKYGMEIGGKFYKLSELPSDMNELEKFIKEHQQQGEVCPECGGKGILPISNAQTQTCYNCNGTGRKQEECKHSYNTMGVCRKCGYIVLSKTSEPMPTGLKHGKPVYSEPSSPDLKKLCEASQDGTLKGMIIAMKQKNAIQAEKINELETKLSEQSHSAQFRRVEMLEEKIKKLTEALKGISCLGKGATFKAPIIAKQVLEN